MLQSYLPVLVFVGLGLIVGVAFATLNKLLGPSRPNKVKSEPYECGLPSEVTKSFRFGISFYLVAMLFILFDIEVVFLYPAPRRPRGRRPTGLRRGASADDDTRSSPEVGALERDVAGDVRPGLLRHRDDGDGLGPLRHGPLRR